MLVQDHPAPRENMANCARTPLPFPSGWGGAISGTFSKIYKMFVACVNSTNSLGTLQQTVSLSQRERSLCTSYDTFFSTYKKACTSFIWGGPTTSYGLVTLPKLKGVIALPDIYKYYLACHLSRIVDWDYTKKQKPGSH